MSSGQGAVREIFDNINDPRVIGGPCSLRRRILVLTGVALAGLAIWLSMSLLTGTREAWDRSLFFLVGLPMMALITAAAGRHCPRTRYLAGIAIVSLQMAAVVFTSPSGTWQIALLGGGIYFFLFAVLCTGTAVAGALSRDRIP